VLAEVNPDPRWGFAFDTEAAAFFMSYFIVCAWILLNAVLAVMIDEFIEAARKSKEKYEKMKAGLAGTEGKDENLNALDPLLEWLMCEIKDKVDLTRMVSKLYMILDRDKRGSCSFEDIYFGLKHLVVSRLEEMERLGAAEQGVPMQLTRDDLVDALYGHKEDFSVQMQDGDVSLDDFKDMLVHQLRDYVHFIVSSELKFAAFTSGGAKPSLAALKFLAMDLEGGDESNEGGGSYSAPRSHQMVQMQKRQDRLEQMLESTMKHLGVPVPPPIADQSTAGAEALRKLAAAGGTHKENGAGSTDNGNGDGAKVRRARRAKATANGEEAGSKTGEEEQEAIKGGNDAGSTPPPAMTRAKSRREKRRTEKADQKQEE